MYARGDISTFSGAEVMLEKLMNGWFDAMREQTIQESGLVTLEVLALML
jgi:hypothetical protein